MERDGKKEVIEGQSLCMIVCVCKCVCVMEREGEKGVNEGQGVCMREREEEGGERGENVNSLASL